MLPSAILRDVTIKDYLVVLKRQIWVIVACFVVINFISVAKTYHKTVLYKASAKILIERATQQIMSNQLSASFYWDRDYINSQINIFSSRTLARKVTDKLIASGDESFKNISNPEDRFLSGVSVSVIPGTQLISVGYISADPIIAAKYANALVDAFIQQDIEKRTNFSKQATGWLDVQLDEVKKKMEASDTALNDYLQQNEIISTPDVESKTQAVLEDLKREKVSIETSLAELSKRYRAKHPKIVALNTRYEAVKNGIDVETKKFLVLNEKMIKYNLLKRDVESSRMVYDSLLKKSKEADVSKDLRETNLRVIDSATIPNAPFSPNHKNDIILGFVLSLIVGVVLAFFLEYLDSSVKTAEDVEMYVRLPLLGYVPSSKQEFKTNKDLDLVCAKVPHSRITEAFRSIRTSIIFSAPEDKPLNTILLTSASPQEGKSTVSMNLSIVFANANEKTLLIEADMRKPRIANSFKIKNDAGLSSFLAGTTDLESSIVKTDIPNLYIMPSGPKPPNPAELLSSVKTRTFLEDIKKQYNRIIIDSPPVITVTDTAILANIVDGVIDVVRANFLNIELILRGRQRLYEAKARVIGVILNNVNVKKEDSYYYYHYYYADDKDKGKDKKA